MRTALFRLPRGSGDRNKRAVHCWWWAVISPFRSSPVPNMGGGPVGPAHDSPSAPNSPLIRRPLTVDARVAATPADRRAASPAGLHAAVERHYDTTLDLCEQQCG